MSKIALFLTLYLAYYKSVTAKEILSVYDTDLYDLIK